jgi:RNA polymerase sigma-70 factor (ECF subfamily)
MDRLRTSGLLAAIEELTPDQRAVLYLRAVADLSVPDIARALDKPESAVKALLRRASASMSRRLAEAGDE